MTRALSAAFCLVLLASAGGAAAKDRQARCAITPDGDPPYSGPCAFMPDEHGSFAVKPVGRKDFFGGVGLISVWITSPGVAEVRGLTADGINSRWGEARRSKTDRACWVGEDFKVCVY